MRFYIADCHFFHDSLNTQMDHRGFGSSEEMNNYMVEKWNSRVRDRDEVVIIGDLSLGKPEETQALLEKLKGRLFLVRGNHDLFGRNKHYDTERFEWIRDYAEIHDNNRRVILCHYPIMFYNGQYRYRQPKDGGIPADKSPASRDSCDNPAWMLYGHVHNTVDEKLMMRFIREVKKTVRTDNDGKEFHIPCQMINCFCGFSDYTPLTLDEWIENDKKRREAVVT